MKSIFLALVFGVLGIVVQAQVNLGNGLVSWLPFSGNTLDVSGNGNNGFATNGGVFTTDRFGQAGSAFMLDGIDDFVRIPDPGSFSSTPFSVSIWFKADVQRLQALIGKRDFGNLNQQQFQIALFLSDQARIASAVISNQIPCSADLTDAVISRNRYSSLFCLEQWHSIIVTFDGQWHRLYFNGVLVSELATTFNQMLSCNADIRIGNWWSGDPLSFQGSVDDFRWYNRAITQDEIGVLSSRDGIAGPTVPDFTMLISDQCNGTEVTFQAIPTVNSVYTWAFGDGSGASSVASAIHRYAREGIYDVTLTSATSSLCTASVTKRINLTRQLANLIDNQDTLICTPARITPRVRSQDIRCAEVNGIRIPGTSAGAAFDVVDSTHYRAESVFLGPELVSNGNFDLGNLGFRSAYVFAGQRNADGQYGVVVNPSSWDNTVSCVDCSGFPAIGSGRFLMADGSPLAGVPVWESVVAVEPNTTYQLRFWAIAYDANALAAPVVRINGREAGVWSPSSGVGRWASYSILWNSGSSNSLTLSIVNNNTNVVGNRFGLDSISVRRHQLSFDSFTVRVQEFRELSATSDTSLCPGDSVTLSVTGGTTYQWTPSSDIDNINTPNPVVYPRVSTWYQVRSPLQNGCTGIDSVLVTVLETPAIDLIMDTSLCAGSSINLLASGASSYSWTPAEGLSNTSVPSPTASPVQTTRYRVRFTESTGCVGEDSVLVTVNAIPVLNVSDDVEICAGEQTSLQVTGGTSYFWFPAAGLSSTSSPNPVAAPASNTRYYVQGFGPGRCFTFDSVLVRVGDTPVLSVRSDTVICQGSSLVLSASGASRYEWAPAGGLSDPTSASTVASPLSTTVYTVTGFGSTGCSTSRAVRVSVGADAGRIFIPNAFTPNGDGLNDCVQVNGGGGATVYEFAIFNRFGERVFLSRTPGECWDGTYRGQRQPAGAFAYYLIIDSPCGPAKLKGTISLIR